MGRLFATLGVTVILLSGLPATASDECRHARGVIGAVVAGDTGAHWLDGLRGGDARCGTSLALGGHKVHHCALSFSYRSDAAKAAYKRLNALLVACSRRRRTGTGAQVNHPDSYQRRRHRMGKVTVDVSIKDKSALGRTFVFVRVVPAKP